MSNEYEYSIDESTVLDLEGVERLKIMVSPNQFAQNNYGPLGTNIFVFHIPSEWDDKILEVYFEPFGKLTSVRIRKESDTNRTLGFGFVAYEHPLSAAKAIRSLNGLRVSNKRLKVAPKKGEEVFLQIAVDQERLAAGLSIPSRVLYNPDLLQLALNHPQVVHTGMLPQLLANARQANPLPAAAVQSQQPGAFIAPAMTRPAPSMAITQSSSLQSSNPHGSLMGAPLHGGFVPAGVHGWPGQISSDGSGQQMAAYGVNFGYPGQGFIPSSHMPNHAFSHQGMLQQSAQQSIGLQQPTPSMSTGFIERIGMANVTMFPQTGVQSSPSGQQSAPQPSLSAQSAGLMFPSQGAQPGQFFPPNPSHSLTSSHGMVQQSDSLQSNGGHGLYPGMFGSAIGFSGGMQAPQQQTDVRQPMTLGRDGSFGAQQGFAQQ